MQHRVEGADLSCIDTTRPYSDGASYRLMPGKEATVYAVMGPHRDLVGRVKNPTNRVSFFSVNHFAEIELRGA